MKIGIFINYAPNVALNTEGLGRYLGTLVKGFIHNGDTVTLACPKWSTYSAEKLLDDFDISKQSVRFLTTRKIPVLWKIYEIKSRGRRVSKHVDVGKVIERALIGLSRKKTILSFGLSGLLLAIASMFLALVFLLVKLLVKTKKRVKKLINRLSIVDYFKRLGSKIFRLMLDDSANELVDIINKNDATVDLWYVPALFWPQVNFIKDKKVIINAPDLVTADFALGFADVTDEKQSVACMETLNRGKYFITYCDYIGHELIDKNYGGMGKEWKTILHSNHDMMPVIAIPKDVSVQMNVDKNFTGEFAKALITQIDTGSAITDGYHLKNMKYIFYASQCRPNKNLLNLIKAYEYLIRKKFLHEKLVLTGNPDTLPDVSKYIEENDLTNDIIFCHGVSNQQLAALYYCAELVVNPTLYEGGFPFTFGEGMSVGTPSVMSDIPQTRGVLEPAGLGEIMFDPIDYHTIAGKIEWALDNLDYLYNLELPLYKKLEDRTDKVVAEEYIRLFSELCGA